MELVREERRAVARVDELDPEQEAAPAHLADDVQVAHRSLELGPERRPALADVLDEPARVELVEHREPDRARKRRAVPGVPVLELARPVRERLVDVLRTEHRGERRVARAEPLAAGHDVGLDRQLLVREPAAGAADAGDDLVEADEESVALAALGESVPELVGG